MERRGWETVPRLCRLQTRAVNHFFFVGPTSTTNPEDAKEDFTLCWKAIWLSIHQESRKVHVTVQEAPVSFPEVSVLLCNTKSARIPAVSTRFPPSQEKWHMPFNHKAFDVRGVVSYIFMPPCQGL